MALGFHHVQFVGGVVDGKEMYVYDLKHEYHWVMWLEMFYDDLVTKGEYRPK